MRKIYLFAAMAALLASCSSDQLPEEQTAQQQNVEPGAVMFDVYAQRSVTRAGLPGSFTTEGLKTGDFAEEGFGVFGFYTNSSTYDQQAIPNFFYNQQVKWDATGGYFKYEPVKYWPNEYGTTAQSEDADKVSFFAYAPYIDVVPATGKPTQEGATPEQTAELQKWGINSLTRNNATGDPMVKYIASFDQDKSVDLCWGVCDNTDWRIIQTGGVQGDLQAGLPWLNVQRPAEAKVLGASGQKLKFTFKHALAQLNVNINAFVDGLDATNSIAAGTKVYVRSITFEGLATKGTLNLNNTEAGANKAYWLDYNGTNDLTTGESVTIYDGRKDGKEGTPSGIATNEKALGLNPDLVQSDVWANSAEGVTKDLRNLFRKYNETTKEYEAADQPIYVIPTGDPVKVTITYDIETADENLATYVSDVQQHGSSVENVITKEIDFGGTTIFENGKSYVINLHLGMNSVKFDATVKEWVSGGAADVDLPYNAPTASVVAGGDPVSIEVPYTASNGLFQVSGLTESETTTNAFTTIAGTLDPTSTTVGSDGMAKVKYTIDQNNSVNDIDGTLTVKGGTSGKVGTLNIKQLAAPLELSVSAVAADGKSITLAAGPADVDWDGSGITVSRSRGGSLTELTKGTKATGIFELNATNKNIIELSDDDEVAAGDIYTITVNPGAGKSKAETVTIKIGGIAFVPDAHSIEYGDNGFNPAPTIYGQTPSAYGYTSGDETVATVVASGATAGEITTLKPGSSAIEATATQEVSDEYFYTTNSKKSNYTLTVTKAVGSISYSLDGKDNQEIAANGTVKAINTAVLKNSHNVELSQGASAGGVVNYSIVDIDGDTGSTKFGIDGDNNLKVGASALTNSTTYTIRLKASVADNDNVSYTTNSQTIVITVTTVAAP